MTITPHQIAMIEASIDFDLSANLEELKQEISHIEKAIAGEEKENDPFFALQKFFHKPTDCFGQLKKPTDPELLIGEILSHMLDFVTRKIQEAVARVNQTDIQIESKDAAPPLKFVFNHEQWKANALKQLPFQFFDKPYQSTRGGLLGNFMLPNPRPPSPMPVVYKYKISSMEEKKFFLEVEVKLSSNQESIKSIAEIFDKKPSQANARSAAEKAAGDIIVAHLLEEKIINESELKDVNDLVRDLLLNQFYLNLLLSPTKIEFKTITKLNLQEYLSLTSLTMINLISSQQCPLEVARRIRHELIEDPFYFKQLSEKKLSLEDLRDVLGNLQVKILLSPSIKKLIHADAISFNQAILMSEACFDLLQQDMEFYLLKILNKQLDFEDIFQITRKQCDFLLSQNVVELLNREQISLRSILMILRNSFLFYLVTHDFLSLEEAYVITPTFSSTEIDEDQFKKYRAHTIRQVMISFIKLAEFGFVLEEDLHVLPKIISELDSQPESKEAFVLPFSLLNNKKVYLICLGNLQARLEAIKEYNPLRAPDGGTDSLEALIIGMFEMGINHLDLWAQIFTARLLAIFKSNDPYYFDEMPDTMTRINEDIQKVIFTFHFSLIQLKDKILQFLLKELLYSSSPDEFGPLYDGILNEICLARDSERKFIAISSDQTPWSLAFNRVVAVARQALTIASFTEEVKEPPNKRRRTFFPPLEAQESEITPLREFCNMIIRLGVNLTGPGPGPGPADEKLSNLSRKRKRE